MDAITSVKSATQAAATRSVQSTTLTAVEGKAATPAARAEIGATTQAGAVPVAKTDTESSSASTRVTLSQQTEPQPNTADRNAKPIDQFKAVSLLR